MKPLLALAFLTSIAVAEDSPFAAWRSVQTVTVTNPGLNRLDLPPGTLDVALPGLEDLRLADESDRIVPIVIEWPLPAATRQPAVQNFHATLQGNRTVLDISTGTDKPVRALMLESAADEFIKAITLEASSDGSTWTTLLTDEMIFRQRTGASRLTFIFADPKPWAYLRATIRDDASAPVPFTGARIEWQEPRTAPVPLDFRITKREELPGKMRLTLDLGAANLNLAELKLHVGDPLFSRRVTVLQNDSPLASGTIHRLRLNDHPSEELTVSVDAQARSREITVVIENNDSPPLKVEGITATRHPVGIAFHAATAGTLRLYSGNVAAPAAKYDVAELANDLRQATASTATTGSLKPSTTFDKSATLPDTGANGAAIDLNAWSIRRGIQTPERGVISVELDFSVLGHANDGFSDLRVIQSGQQLPFIIQRPQRTTKIKAAITAEPADPKRPTTSRWRVTLPNAHLPVRTLKLTSPTTLFERWLRVSEERRDSYGNKGNAQLTSSQWSQVPGRKGELKMSMGLRWSGDSVLIETDNGDNSPIQIDGAEVELDLVSLRFKTTDPSPVQLYYGNPRARTPRYDIRLVEKELTTATPVVATLDPEESLTSSRPMEPNAAGTPWLWLALGVVVIGLIAVIAKLLPKVET